MNYPKIDILGVKVDKVTLDQAVEQVEEWLGDNGKHYIVTPNPEFIMAAQKDPEFKKILNGADLAVPDGTRLDWASKMLAEKSLFKRILISPFFMFSIKQLMQFDIVPGVELMERLCGIVVEKGFTVGFLGGKNGVAEKCAECLQKKYPGLEVVFAEDGGEVDGEGRQLKPPRLFRLPKTDLLFVAFGQVKQEKWIANNLPQIPVRVVMGVGGSFDEIAGKVPQAPQWVKNLGLKWLFRLTTQPWRLKRQLNLVKFVWLVWLRS